MRFAVALPWWGYALAFGVAGLLAWAAYARASVHLTAAQRTGLTLLRATALFLIVAALLRPVAVVPSDVVATRVVPLLIDTSRSMRLEDDDGTARIEQARALGRQIVELLGPAYRVEWLTFGESLARSTPDEIAATARRSDLTAALEETAERYRNERVAGIVVLSDGGDTSNRRLEEGRLAGTKVFPVGVGTSALLQDREVVNVTAGEPLLPEASIDLSVSAVSRGFGTDPVELRVSANGRPVEIRRVIPAADGAPIHEVFTVSPAAGPAHGLHRGDPRRQRRSRGREQPPQRAGAAAGGAAQGPDGGRRAGLRAHVPEARAGRGPRPGRGLRRPQGTERRWPRHVLRAGGGEPRGRAVGRLSRHARSAVPVRRHHLRQRRSGLLHPRSAGPDRALRRRARRRAAGAGRALVRAAGPDRHAARGSVAGGSDRSSRDDAAARRRSGRGRRRRGGQRSFGDARWRRASGHAPHRHRGQQPQVVAAAAGARFGGPGRRAAARRAGPGGDREPRRRGAPADRGAALRPGPDDDLRRRGVVALAHDAPGLGYDLRHRSGDSWCAGWRPPPPARCRSRRWRWPCRAAPNR